MWIATSPGPRTLRHGDQVFLRFDSDPRTHHAAAGATYIAVGGTWAPDSGGYSAGWFVSTATVMGPVEQGLATVMGPPVCQ